jgi:hypothetical protein
MLPFVSRICWSSVVAADAFHTQDGPASVQMSVEPSAVVPPTFVFQIGPALLLVPAVVQIWTLLFKSSTISPMVYGVVATQGAGVGGSSKEGGLFPSIIGCMP